METLMRLKNDVYDRPLYWARVVQRGGYPITCNMKASGNNLTCLIQTARPVASFRNKPPFGRIVALLREVWLVHLPDARHLLGMDDVLELDRFE